MCPKTKVELNVYTCVTISRAVYEQIIHIHMSEMKGHRGLSFGIFGIQYFSLDYLL